MVVCPRFVAIRGIADVDADVDFGEILTLNGNRTARFAVTRNSFHRCW